MKNTYPAPFLFCEQGYNTDKSAILIIYDLLHFVRIKNIRFRLVLPRNLLLVQSPVGDCGTFYEQNNLVSKNSGGMP